MNLGEYISQKRKEKGWSQRELAAASDISNAEISRIESGKRKEPSPSVLKSIANALSIPVEDLLQVAGVLEESTVEKGRQFVASMSDQPIPKDLTEEELEEVKKFVDYLISKRK
ncbi:helix-turn-helix transcriptional regulator [uncultured Mitsuokella sp.]|uniref:helix-turn-helix domain-containing protein n=1 Tax=uncultured Mitsuokella sp. TaxID=453120 RepID=UPI0026100712|nr:helix-turn-helix transcriptional regulator [uncultured Mitsuokella sp.]